MVLHQPERGLLLSGDHLLGRVSLYYDYGYTPDPAGEFLDSLDVVDAARRPAWCWPATAGRVRDVRGADRGEPARRCASASSGVRAAVADGPRTPFEIVPTLLGDEASRR